MPLSTLSPHKYADHSETGATNEKKIAHEIAKVP